MSNDEKTLYERLVGTMRSRRWRMICCPGSGPIRSSGGSGRIAGKTASCARRHNAPKLRQVTILARESPITPTALRREPFSTGCKAANSCGRSERRRRGGKLTFAPISAHCKWLILLRRLRGA